VKVDGIAESGRPEATMFMLFPVESSVNHDCTASLNDVFDPTFCHSIVLMTTNATVLDTLTLGGQFGGKFLQSVPVIVGIVGANMNANGGSFLFKTELSLHSFGLSKTHRMNDNQLGASGITNK
jgi:hypothetical protein